MYATPPKVLVVGAGPVGALAALYAAHRGFHVEVYELRGDLRDPSTVPLNFTRSINLALSERGINSMRLSNCSGLVDAVIRESIPMHGRMIHGKKDGALFEQSQKYDVHGRAIRAIDRGGLNTRLLDKLEAMPNVKLFFNCKLTGADFKRNLAWIERQDRKHNDSSQIDRQEEFEVPFDMMIGADGAHSAVRFHLMKFARVSYRQEYIDTLWCEFTIPPPQKGDIDARPDGYRLSPNHLHIWPAGSFMFIAIPSNDKSFTCTLFMSHSQFENMDAHPETIVPFFTKHFPGVVDRLIKATDLQDQYRNNPHLPLISIKCNPYHYSSSVVILGDAAHAMVPFYGQGMNAGLEDVRVLFEILDKNKAIESAENRANALQEYTIVRCPDAHAINDLSMGNYEEMRAAVRSPFYMLRKKTEELLDQWMPSLDFTTQYTRVSFSNQRYSELQKSVHRQGVALSIMGATALGLLTASATFAAWRWRLR